MESVLVAHTDFWFIYESSFENYYICRDAFFQPLVNMMLFRIRL